MSNRLLGEVSVSRSFRNASLLTAKKVHYYYEPVNSELSRRVYDLTSIVAYVITSMILFHVEWSVTEEEKNFLYLT